MNIIGRPGIAKVNFEIYCLVVSAITGCGMCINAHVHELKKSGLDDLGIQSAIRIGAVVNSVSEALHIG
jgi:alkyl hydroperoxide reductase subunit D